MTLIILWLDSIRSSRSHHRSSNSPQSIFIPSAPKSFRMSSPVPFAFGRNPAFGFKLFSFLHAFRYFERQSFSGPTHYRNFFYDFVFLCQRPGTYPPLFMLGRSAFSVIRQLFLRSLAWSPQRGISWLILHCLRFNRKVS